MCTSIVVEKKYVVKAVREFKERYPVAASHTAAMRWGAKFAREGCVIDNENGSFTVTTASRAQSFLIVNKVCACGISNPCAHRIAVNLAKRAIEIRARESECLLERAEMQAEFAETRGQYYTESAETRRIMREQEAR